MTDETESALVAWAESVNMALFFTEVLYQLSYETAWGRRWLRAEMPLWDSVDGRWCSEFAEVSR